MKYSYEKRENERQIPKNMDDIRAYVIENGFGRNEYLPGIYFSRGIQYAIKMDPVVWDSYLAKALNQVRRNDYGGFYEYDESPVPGREFYICVSPFGKDINTGIMAHWTGGDLTFYFQFEW